MDVMWMRIVLLTFFAGFFYYMATHQIPSYGSARKQRIWSMVFFWVGFVFSTYSIHHLEHIGFVFYQKPTAINLIFIYDIAVAVMILWGMLLAFYFMVVSAFAPEKWMITLETGRLFFIFWVVTTVIGAVAWLQTYRHAHPFPLLPQ